MSIDINFCKRLNCINFRYYMYPRIYCSCFVASVNELSFFIDEQGDSFTDINTIPKKCPYYLEYLMEEYK